MKSLPHKLLEVAVAAFAAAWLLNLAWELLLPLLPTAVFVALVYGFLQWRRR